MGRDYRCGGYIDRKSLLERMPAARKPEDRRVRVEGFGFDRAAKRLILNAYPSHSSHQTNPLLRPQNSRGRIVTARALLP
ncbi:hypothetical protein MPLSOD_40147 [Mesorhizobium sp. SOD10]|nr:hypothetical protein MPLSOD_40147 [Mesorhizobium sp. SOD10]